MTQGGSKNNPEHGNGRSPRRAVSRLTLLGKTVSGAKSASRRYPRELLRSLRGEARWSNGAAGVRETLDRMSASPMGAAWLGHATALLRLDDQLILTDPVLSNRIGPRIGGRSFGLGRLEPAPIGPRELPSVSVILLSHAHFDHLDVPTLRELAAPTTVVITAAGTRSLVPPGFGAVYEIDWGDTLKVGGVSVTAIKPNHWGARTALDRSRGYNSYLLETLGSKARRVLFGGDTAMTRAFDRLGVDLAILGIGGYQPWEHAHATPEQVWEMADQMRAERVLPMHHSTFPLSEEPVGEPLERLLSAAGKHSDRIAPLKAGQAITE
ncbi:MAG: hypothetical protein GIKADHBN_02989 [Phycisphaerales bacterium]|nr:hypothetical protein [Phycisphaerales bacterium]